MSDLISLILDFLTGKGQSDHMLPYLYRIFVESEYDDNDYSNYKYYRV